MIFYFLIINHFQHLGVLMELMLPDTSIRLHFWDTFTSYYYSFFRKLFCFLSFRGIRWLLLLLMLGRFGLLILKQTISLLMYLVIGLSNPLEIACCRNLKYLLKKDKIIKLKMTCFSRFIKEQRKNLLEMLMMKSLGRLEVKPRRKCSFINLAKLNVLM